MSMKYNLLKLVVGIVNIGYLMYSAISEKNAWNILIAVVLLYLIVKSVAFAQYAESLWVFVIAIFAFIPFNIKLSCMVAELFFRNNILTLIIFRFVFYLCFLAMEELVLGIGARVIWKKQKETLGNV